MIRVRCIEGERLLHQYYKATSFGFDIDAAEEAWRAYKAHLATCPDCGWRETEEAKDENTNTRI